ncbi:MAG: hypothetical protein LRS48_04935 [Desulfurococcales archaeon]|nr:hypothetical protein [Desulfurococcales archaeon]
METNRLGVREALEKLPDRRLVLLVDTNFLVYIAKGLIAPSQIIEALTAPYAPLIPSSVVGELNMLASSSKPSLARAARKALELAARLGWPVIECGQGKTDDVVYRCAVTLKSMGRRIVVATCDKRLRGRLRLAGIPTLYYRESESRLETDWETI